MNPATEAGFIRYARSVGCGAITLRHPPHPHQVCSGFGSALFDWSDADPDPPELDLVNPAPRAGLARSYPTPVALFGCTCTCARF